MVAETLLEAYRRALYVVLATPPLVLRVGEASADLDALLAAEGTSGAAFVTAANPASVVRGAHENLVALAALVASQNALGYRCFEAEGRDPAGAWPVEPSVLVVGIPREGAVALARAYGQNALVWFEVGGVGELVVTG